MSVTEEPAGENCPAGGHRIDTGLDGDQGGDLSTGEILAGSTSYVCHGQSTSPDYLDRAILAGLYRTPGVMTLASDAAVADAPVGTGQLILTQLARTPYDPLLLDTAAVNVIAYNSATAQLYWVGEGGPSVGVVTRGSFS